MDMEPLAGIVKQEIEENGELYMMTHHGQVDVYRSSDKEYVGSFFEIGGVAHVAVYDTRYESMMGEVRHKILHEGERQRMSLMRFPDQYLARTARRELQHTPI